MRKHILAFLLTLAFLGILLSGCNASMSPPAGVIEPTQPGEPPSLPKTPASSGQPAIHEPRLLTLEWPARLRVGDSDTIRLTLEVDENGNINPTAMIEGHETGGERVFVPNLYETHNVLAEARLDIAGLTYTPTSEVIEPLLPGQPVTFFWSIQPEHVGKYRGTLWLHLNFIPKDPAGQEARLPISAQLVEIEAVNFLGLSGNAARITGWIGVTLGSILSLDKLFDFATGLLKPLRRKPE